LSCARERIGEARCQTKRSKFSSPYGFHQVPRDGGPNLNYAWIASDQSRPIATVILQDLAVNGYQIVKKGKV
jgi:hypothetical protein